MSDVTQNPWLPIKRSSQPQMGSSSREGAGASDRKDPAAGLLPESAEGPICRYCRVGRCFPVNTPYAAPLPARSHAQTHPRNSAHRSEEDGRERPRDINSPQWTQGPAQTQLKGACCSWQQQRTNARRQGSGRRIEPCPLDSEDESMGFPEEDDVSLRLDGHRHTASMERPESPPPYETYSRPPPPYEPPTRTPRQNATSYSTVVPYTDDHRNLNIRFEAETKVIQGTRPRIPWNRVLGTAQKLVYAILWAVLLCMLLSMIPLAKADAVPGGEMLQTPKTDSRQKQEAINPVSTDPEHPVTNAMEKSAATEYAEQYEKAAKPTRFAEKTMTYLSLIHI